MAVRTPMGVRAAHGAWPLAARGARGAALLIAAGFALGTPGVSHAQEPAPAPHSPGARPWPVTTSHYGKWVTLAGAAGLIAVSAVRRGEANDAIHRLDSFCRQDFSRCEIAGNRYVDDMAEAIFQEHVGLDRKAQGLLIGGQATLIVSGTMFLVDLIWDDDETENIPYTPLRVFARPGEIGLALAF